jgi:hypothetical protein
MGGMSGRTASGMAPNTWARGNPIGDQMPWSSVLIDYSEAEAGSTDLEAEGLTQMFAGVDVPMPTAELIAAIGTPYDVELIRLRDFDPWPARAADVHGRLVHRQAQRSVARPRGRSGIGKPSAAPYGTSAPSNRVWGTCTRSRQPCPATT